MSTSTYVPTFLSDKNWPEITWKVNCMHASALAIAAAHVHNCHSRQAKCINHENILLHFNSFKFQNTNYISNRALILVISEKTTDMNTRFSGYFCYYVLLSLLFKSPNMIYINQVSDHWRAKLLKKWSRKKSLERIDCTMLSVSSYQNNISWLNSTKRRHQIMWLRSSHPQTSDVLWALYYLLSVVNRLLHKNASCQKFGQCPKQACCTRVQILVHFYSFLLDTDSFYWVKAKVKCAIIPLEHGLGAHLPSWAREPVGDNTTNVCDAWPVWRQTYGYLPSCKASPPIVWYQIILLGDRGTCVNNLHRIVLSSMAAEIRTRNWFDCNSSSLTTRPLSPAHTHVVSTAIFPGEPGLVGCLVNSPSPFIPELRILLGQA